ncbi:unnamed protein product [Calicophoron daubneyi]|uniref:Phospholipase B-like n=1 Tax=Calicophoron daubneyi TaxID=300641 RepID=A0AAV2TZR0_CALDB
MLYYQTTSTTQSLVRNFHVGLSYCLMLKHVILLLLLSVSLADRPQRAAIICHRNNGAEYFRYIQEKNYNKNFIVSEAVFADGINEIGWSILSVFTSEQFPEHYQAYWAGFLETNLTYSLTNAHILNTLANVCPQPYSQECIEIRNYLSTNLEYMINTGISLGSRDEFWHQIEMQMWQLRGMSDAFTHTFIESSQDLTENYLRSLKDKITDLYLLQLMGDFIDLPEALSLEGLTRRLGLHMNTDRFGPSCSALIRLLKSDVYLSHVTWSSYTMMLRVLKNYQFPWRKCNTQDSTAVPGSVITFSSYPSVISSIDDFYITNSRLVVTETTILNFNKDLWKYVRSGARSSVFTPFRAMAANRLARNGPEWVSYFKRNNSGTYNNEWMVFDANLFHPDKSLPSKGLLIVAEQMPGTIYHEDLTKVLIQQGYWPSYNLPYFSYIYNISGTRDDARKYGDWFDYHETARAKIFRRDVDSVTDLATMYKLMRYNDFRHDPLSRCNCTPPYTAENAISARNDLNDPNGTYPISSFRYRLHGGTDVKITNYTMLCNMNMLAASGPTYTDLPPFQWSKLPVPVERPRMHPDKWMFAPMVTNFGPGESGCRALQVYTQICIFTCLISWLAPNRFE